MNTGKYGNVLGLKVLITNYHLHSPGGTEIYVRDLAMELVRQGHFPAVYTPNPGTFSEELQTAGIPVTSKLRRFKFRPDVIHGHHKVETLAALERFPWIPAIYICHDHTHFVDGLVIHPRIRRYFAVSNLCAERLIKEGLAGHKVHLIQNFVDTNRFQPRPPLPDRPRRALLFSNYAKAETHLPAVTEACRRMGLPLDVIGAGVGNSLSNPESVIGQYDLVFAKAKAAMEAMAVGAAVILCDFGGVGPMVTAAEFDRLRPMNFGFQALCDPLEPENIVRQVARYNPSDVALVRERIRAEASLASAVQGLTEVYEQVIKEHNAAIPWFYRKLLSIFPFINRGVEKLLNSRI